MNIANKQLYLYIFCKCKEHRFITLTFSMTACVRRKEAPLPVKRLVLLIKLVFLFFLNRQCEKKMPGKHFEAYRN